MVCLSTFVPYILPLLTGAIALPVGFICMFLAFKLIKMQRKLHNSISLVELKGKKMFYFVLLIVPIFLTIYVVLQMIDKQSFESALMEKIMGMGRMQTNIMLSCLLFLLLSVTFVLSVLALSKCAVVDKGIYTGTRYLEWYHVHDYIIDEDQGLVVLSSDKNTFATLKGTTPPLKVSKNDIPKLKFILNKNKNKFSSKM